MAPEFYTNFANTDTNGVLAVASGVTPTLAQVMFAPLKQASYGADHDHTRVARFSTNKTAEWHLWGDASPPTAPVPASASPRPPRA